MSVATVKGKLTYEDFLGFPEDGLRHEIIEGRHFASPPPNIRHQRVSMYLSLRLAAYCERTAAGEVFAAPVGVVLGAHDVFEPDLIFVSRQQADRITEANLQGAPDLAIEILSPSTRRRDENLKRQRYEALGVEEYWIVNPVEESIAVYRRGEKGFGAPIQYLRGAMLESPLLPGLAIPVARIFQ